jgi:hypothetical protein
MRGGTLTQETAGDQWARFLRMEQKYPYLFLTENDSNGYKDTLHISEVIPMDPLSSWDRYSYIITEPGNTQLKDVIWTGGSLYIWDESYKLIDPNTNYGSVPDNPVVTPFQLGPYGARTDDRIATPEENDITIYLFNKPSLFGNYEVDVEFYYYERYVGL